jgi:hypothetical protein
MDGGCKVSLAEDSPRRALRWSTLSTASGKEGCGSFFFYSFSFLFSSPLYNLL